MIKLPTPSTFPAVSLPWEASHSNSITPILLYLDVLLKFILILVGFLFTEEKGISSVYIRLGDFPHN